MNGFHQYLQLLAIDIQSDRYFNFSSPLPQVNPSVIGMEEVEMLISAPPGPRFALIFLYYLITARPNSFLPKFTLIVGLIRTVMCGGWVYVTSTDDHKWHDIFMVSYLLLTLPWILGCLASSPMNARAVKYRRYLSGAFVGTLVPLTYFFLQHKVHKVPGGKFFLQYLIP